MNPKILVLFLLLWPTLLFADTFTVTSNANSGPGTLREALQKASDNGTANQDLISFNLGLSISQRTIILSSELPNVSSNLVIDGTTQPGNFMGVSHAKIIITPKDGYNGRTQLNYCFRLDTVSNIKIYGLYIKGFSEFDRDGGLNEPPCITLNAVTNFTFGGPGKGNIMAGDCEGIAKGYFAGGASNITIQGNIFGVDTDGVTRILPQLVFTNGQGISLTQAANVLIGGNNLQEGNLFTGNSAGAVFIEVAGSVTVGYNRFSTNADETQFFVGYEGLGSRNCSATFLIHDNTFFGDNEFNEDTGHITVINNFFGVNRYKTAELQINNGFGGIAFNNCFGGATVGGSDIALGNIFHGGLIGVGNNNSSGVAILKNSFSCHSDDGIYLNNWYTLPNKPFITVTKETENYIEGMAKPNSLIEVFYSDSCQRCEGQVFITRIKADANGKWSYTGDVKRGIVATATNSDDSTTSGFSRAVIDQSAAVISNSSCGKNNGSISGVKVVSGSQWHWENDKGDTIGMDIELHNVGPGSYKFVCTIGYTGCQVSTQFFPIVDISPELVSDYAQLTNPTCGQANGSITNIYIVAGNNLKQAWTDAGGHFISNEKDLVNVGDGSYTFTLTDTVGKCSVKAGPYKLVNQSGPTLNTGSAQIADATCSRSNGSIKNITYQNAADKIYIAWVDSLGKIVGNSIDLLNVPAGKYRIKFKDGGGCDTITGPYFTVANKGDISFDTSRMNVTSSSCRGADGSIKGITSVNAETYTWVNTATGNTVGSGQDISSIPAATYKLNFSNSFGCGASTDPIIVKPASFLSETVINDTIVPPNCGLTNGYIQPITFSRDTSLYTFQWINDPGSVLSVNLSIYNLSPGTYTLYATDPNGCRQSIYSATLTQQNKPVLVYDNVNLGDDTCSAGKGFIQNLATQEKPLNYTWAWFSTNGQQVGNTKNGISGLRAGGYYATVTDTYNCSVTSKTFTLNNIVQPQAAPQVAGQYIQRGTTATLIVTNPQTGMYYLYDTVTATIPVNSSTGGILTTPPVRYDKQFYVQYISGDCESPRTPVLVKVFDSTIVSIPNAFSPNGDGINDTWRIQVNGIIANYALIIFNRYGQNVFTSNDVNTQWNGTLNRKPVPVGTYYYILQGHGENNRPIKMSGYVVVLR